MATDHLPAADRFPFWLDMVTQTVGLHEIRSEYVTDFQATLRSVDLGGIRLGLFDLPPVDARYAASIDGGDVYHLAIPIRGPTHITQGRSRTSISPGQLLLYNGSAPYRSVLEGPTGEPLCRAMLVAVPGTMMPIPHNRLDRLADHPISGRAGLGRLVRRHLFEVTTQADHYDTTSTPSLTAVTRELIVLMLTHEMGIQSALSPDEHQQLLLARVREFVRQNLGDPQLSPARIAATHHISTRTLHRLFQDQDTTVSELIRSQRLRRSVDDLINPANRNQPVEEIAYRWGYLSLPHFNRTFRAAYGIPPGAYRDIFRRQHDQASAHGRAGGG